MQPKNPKDEGMLPAHQGIGGGYVVETSAQEIVPAVESGTRDELDDVIRLLKEQGAEVVFPGKRPDGSPRRF